MPQGTSESNRVTTRVISVVLAIAVVMACVLYTLPQAFANFSSESTDQTIGVGRIQSTTATEPSAGLVAATHFVAPEQLAVEPAQEAVTQLAQPLDRGIEDLEGALNDIYMIQQFGEPDEAGWFTTTASAYGPSSAGTHTATGTELTLESMDIGCQIAYMDIFLGRTIDISYGGAVLRCKVVDTGTLAPGRLFDFQPGVCTFFGAETPEFGWGVRTVQWRFAD